jgi:hypothetical protein
MQIRQSRIPLKPKQGLTRISCTRHQATAARAAFIKESRMKCINANKLHRKSGEMGHPASVGLYLVRALHVANAWQAPQAAHNTREVPHVFGFQNKVDYCL